MHFNQVTTALATVYLGLQLVTPADAETMRYIDNGIIRVGVDLDIGGAITHVSHLERGDNLINSHDWGRQIQMSFYSGPRNYQREGKRKSPNWANFPWNPIQAGDSFGNGAQVREYNDTGQALYVKSIPMLWPMDNDPGECRFETWIELHNNTFRYRAQLSNQRGDTTAYPPFHQEVPALYTNGPWHRLMTYVGEQPFTNAPLTEVRKSVREPWPWSKWLGSENWAALVDDHGWGIGVWHPGVFEFHGGFSGRERGRGGPKDSPTGYLAPIHTDILDHNIVYQYDCVFVVGSLADIRNYASAHRHESHIHTWRFQTDRQHWTVHHAADQGFPLAGSWILSLDQRRARIQSPFLLWHAAKVPRLRLKAAFKTRGNEARLYWRPYSGTVHTTASWADWQKQWWTAERSIAVPIRNHGAVEEYVIELAEAPGYSGTLCGLRLDLPEASPGETVEVLAISLDTATQ